MVLGLIDFLLGGKKKTKVPRKAQASAPLQSVGGSNEDKGSSLPDGQSKATENFESSKHESQQVEEKPQADGNGFKKKSATEVIHKMHSELKDTNQRITDLIGDVKNLETTVNSLGHRVDDLEVHKNEVGEKLEDVDANMSKFLSLYELINNEYNPFVDAEDHEKMKKQPKEVVLTAEGGSEEEPAGNDAQAALAEKLEKSSSQPSAGTEDFESSLLELDTLDIEEAAGDAVPLTQLKNNTNSLVIILSWLEYLIKRVGIEETRNSLRYYTEVLRWTTPEVYFDLDKYLRGMKDKTDLSGDEKLNVRDHIVSLYFISKLNEKALDEKLTKAVLQIIKH